MRAILERAGMMLCALSFAVWLVPVAAGAAATGDAVFGLRNLAGEARVATPLPDGTYTAGGADFTARAGLLTPAADLRGARPGRHVLAAPGGGAAQTLVLKADARCVSTSQELRTVLKLPAAGKSGLTVCLNPGRYTDLTGPDFADVFLDPDTRAPITFEAADPAARPVLNFWMMRSTDAARPNGGVILRNLDFVLEDVPVLGPGETGFIGIRAAVMLSAAGETRSMVMEGLHVRGSLGQARDGQPELERNLVGVYGYRLHDVVIRDSRFENIVDGIAVAGTDILIERNRVRHSWGDFLRIGPQILPDRACAETRGVTVRDNIFSQPWTNSRLHPDFVHLFAANGVSCDVNEVLIEGNIAFPGRDGMRQPGYPSWLAGSAPGPVPARLPARDRVLHRLTGSGTTTLPDPVCGADGLQIGVQRDVASTGPIELRAPGAPMRLNAGLTPSITLTEPGEAWYFRCRTDSASGQDYWFAQPSLPSMQGVFSNSLPGDAAFGDITVRHNILWVTAPAGVSFRDDADHGIEVVRNSLLLPWPGDLNGDGRPNEFKDGFNTLFNSGIVMIGEKTEYSMRNNVLGHPDQHGDDSNDSGLRQDDGGRSVAERFVFAPDASFSPQTAQEAVALARPRAGSFLAARGAGAVGVTPGDDPYDWSWVSNW